MMCVHFSILHKRDMMIENHGSSGYVSVGLCCVCGPQELQSSILSLATKILVGCDEVLETLQQVTTALINSDIPDRETR